MKLLVGNEYVREYEEKTKERINSSLNAITREINLETVEKYSTGIYPEYKFSETNYFIRLDYDGYLVIGRKHEKVNLTKSAEELLMDDKVPEVVKKFIIFNLDLFKQKPNVGFTITETIGIGMFNPGAVSIVDK